MLADQIRAQLTLETYESNAKRRTTWSDFRQRYEDNILSGQKTRTVAAYRDALERFGRILKLDKRPMSYVNSERVAEFVAKRRTEPGKKPGSTLSPATLNSNLRIIKAALNQAVEWGYLDKLPKVRMEKEPQKLPTFMRPEHFTAIYEACELATRPEQIPYSQADWWRGLLATGYMTGWRISELLALRWEDVDMDSETAITRAEDNKGSRDEVTKLHPFVVDHLRKLRSFGELVFPWSHHRRTLDVEFARIQDAAGIDLPCSIPRKHDCTPACHRYGFHDERRSFATRCRQAGIEPEVLQTLMRHKSYSTTLRYVNMADAVNPAVAALDAPTVKMG